MGLINDIKKDAKKSASNKGKFIYFKEGAKARVRFLEEPDEGIKIVTHRNYEKSINVVCKELFGEECEYCGDDSLSTRNEYLFCVYDYDAKEVKFIGGAANSYSPVPQLVGMFEAYGTLTDRDYVITQNGSKTSKSFTVVPMDKAKFRNKKAKPFSKKAKLKIIKDAFSDDSDDNDNNDKEEVTLKEKLLELDKDDLFEICEEFELDEDEYDELSKKKLVKYMLKNIDEEELEETLEDYEDDDDE